MKTVNGRPYRIDSSFFLFFFDYQLLLHPLLSLLTLDFYCHYDDFCKCKQDRTFHLFIHSFISCKQNFFFWRKKINFAIESIALAAKRNSHHFFWVLVFSINPHLIYEHRIQTIELFIEDLMNDISLSVCVYEPDFFFNLFNLISMNEPKKKNQSPINLPTNIIYHQRRLWWWWWCGLFGWFIYEWKWSIIMMIIKIPVACFFLNEIKKNEKKSYFVLDLTWIACISFFLYCIFFSLVAWPGFIPAWRTTTHTHLIHQNELIF